MIEKWNKIVGDGGLKLETWFSYIPIKTYSQLFVK